jgi:hypothetical protein
MAAGPVRVLALKVADADDRIRVAITICQALIEAGEPGTGCVLPALGLE